MFKDGNVRPWMIVVAILLFFAIIYTLNQMAKDNARKKANQNNINTNITEYTQKSNTIISEGSIPEEYQVDFGTTLENFYQSCVDHYPDQAYDMLSTDTKRIYYPTLQSFIDKYYNPRFQGDMKYSYQAWKTNNNRYTYQVKIYENMLTTGKANDTYSEDFATIDMSSGELKLNINGYIGRKQISKQANNENVSIAIEYVDTYMDYEIYTFRIKNNTRERYLLDTRKNTDTVNLKNDKEYTSVAFLFENSEEDLTLEPNESEEIKIKFNDQYATDVKEINFTDIVKEAEYLNNIKTQNREQISIEL